MGQLQPHANVIALHRLQIASPCTASWEQMAGDARVRHCGGCNKNVFNLSAMPEAEAASLLAEQRAGGVCVRFYRRADGTVMTGDCGAPSAGAGAAWRTLPGLATAAMLAMSLAACSPSPSLPEGVTMGPPPQVDAPVVHSDAGAATKPPYVMGEAPVPASVPPSR